MLRFSLKLAFIKSLFLSSFSWFSELALYEFIRVRFRSTMQKRNVEAVPGEDVESRQLQLYLKRCSATFLRIFKNL